MMPRRLPHFAMALLCVLLHVLLGFVPASSGPWLLEARRDFRVDEEPTSFVLGDFDGDGRDTVSIYRPSNQTIYVINQLGSNDAGLGAADYSFMFGNPGDVPFVGDFDGNGVDSIGLYRQSSGFVYFRDSLSTGIADLEFFYGNPGDVILAVDGRPTDSVAQLLSVLDGYRIGDRVVLQVWRSGRRLTMEVTLGGRD